MTINPELKAKIDALPYEALKVRIRNVLNRPVKQAGTGEDTIEHIVNSYTEVMGQSALREARMYRWRDDEVIASIEYFKKEMPNEYAAYLQQERNGRQIDGDLAWDMRRLGARWLPGLDDDDCRDLFSKVRDHAEAHLI